MAASQAAQAGSTPVSRSIPQGLSHEEAAPVCVSKPSFRPAVRIIKFPSKRSGRLRRGRCPHRPASPRVRGSSPNALAPVHVVGADFISARNQVHRPPAPCISHPLSDAPLRGVRSPMVHPTRWGTRIKTRSKRYKACSDVVRVVGVEPTRLPTGT